jgi:chromosome segregation ATPase
MQPTPQQTIDDLQRRLAKLRGQVRVLQRAGKIVQRETKATATLPSEDKTEPLRRKLKEQQTANAAKVKAQAAEKKELKTQLREQQQAHIEEVRKQRVHCRSLDRKRQALEQKVRDKDHQIKNLQSKLAAAEKNYKAMQRQLREQTDLSARLQTELIKLRKDKKREGKKETRRPS